MKDIIILMLAFISLVGVGLFSGCNEAPSGNTGLNVNIAGAWHGTYHSNAGDGEWSWSINKTSTGSYTGLLTTTGPYSGQHVPITVTLSGDKITVGWVAVGVVFEGTVSGDSMSGTWRFQSGMDSGPWNGERGEVDITPHFQNNMQSDNESNGGENENNGTTNNYDTTNEVDMIGNQYIKDVEKDIKDTLIDVFGGAKRSTVVNQSGNFGVGYVVKRAPESNDVDNVANGMENKGYTTNAKTSEGMMVSKNVAGFGIVNVIMTINQGDQEITAVISTTST